ncbi:LicD family [Geosmithia morbida]|uniref:LicD family n=1 Tax=Geosmithia morbida TaxID=1094350 RepID=A0A9P4YM40_9HYPO|nr:LicD family [Geosmithia morbida]KAF4119498.1 LicD family [Geosmithia morbida]
MLLLRLATVLGLAATVSATTTRPGDGHGTTTNIQTRETKAKTPKYFREPGGSLALSHYDARYYQSEVPYSEHREVLRGLVQSYLTTFRQYGIETWLAHGTLLGWWWNGQVMPWDYDLDMQVSNHTLTWLGDNLNGTEHAYNVTLSAAVAGAPTVETRSYLLDVNPHHSEVKKGDGRNIIDARWIDTSNGMFIDITAVRERHEDRPGLWSCKNNHRYDSTDLWPMRLSLFEGVKANVPYNFQRILSDEYEEKGLVAEQWEGHRWDARIKDWVKMSSSEEKEAKAKAQQHKLADMEAQNSKQDNS